MYYAIYLFLYGAFCSRIYCISYMKWSTSLHKGHYILSSTQITEDEIKYVADKVKERLEEFANG